MPRGTPFVSASDEVYRALAKIQPTTTSTGVRDPKTGNFQTVRGVGALKGRLTLDKGVDLTKPIAAQVMKGGGSRKNATQNL